MFSISVTGLTITFSPNTVSIGSSSTENFTITCNVNNDPSLGDRDVISALTLVRGGENLAWLSVYNTIAEMSFNSNTMPRASYSYSYDDTDKGSTSLIMTTRMSNIRCTDALEYKCALIFSQYNPGGEAAPGTRNASENLTVSGK